MKKKVAFLMIAFILGMLLLRTALAGICLPEGILLENLARSVRLGDTTVAEAVTAFCQEIIHATPET